MVLQIEVTQETEARLRGSEEELIADLTVAHADCRLEHPNIGAGQ